MPSKDVDVAASLPISYYFTTESSMDEFSNQHQVSSRNNAREGSLVLVCNRKMDVPGLAREWRNLILSVSWTRQLHRGSLLRQIVGDGCCTCLINRIQEGKKRRLLDRSRQAISSKLESLRHYPLAFEVICCDMLGVFS